MGFLDTAKSKAGDLATDAERSGRATRAQTGIAVLQQDLGKAGRELGHKVSLLRPRRSSPTNVTQDPRSCTCPETRRLIA